MHYGNEKLCNLHLGDPFLPSEGVQWVESGEEVIPVHHHMYEGVHGQNRYCGRGWGNEIAPISQQGDRAVMKHVEEGYLADAMPQHHEHSVQQLVQLGEPVDEHPVPKKAIALFRREEVPNLHIWREDNYGAVSQWCSYYGIDQHHLLGTRRETNSYQHCQHLV